RAGMEPRPYNIIPRLQTASMDNQRRGVSSFIKRIKIFIAAEAWQAELWAMGNKFKNFNSF
ncbi:MAG: hypothetical protein IJA16_00670, partial [Clostridia bacterium]|nr:hypothetical protein [Clostridia bacterium]